MPHCLVIQSWHVTVVWDRLHQGTYLLFSNILSKKYLNTLRSSKFMWIKIFTYGWNAKCIRTKKRMLVYRIAARFQTVSRRPLIMLGSVPLSYVLIIKWSWCKTASGFYIFYCFTLLYLSQVNADLRVSPLVCANSYGNLVRHGAILSLFGNIVL